MHQGLEAIEGLASRSDGPRARSLCAVCVMRHQGLCQGVDDQDEVGSAMLSASHAPIRVYDAGDVIYDQGDPEEHVFILVSGWVALHRDLADGRRQIIQFLQPGAMFAVEPAGEPLSHGATTLTNASICPIATTRLGDLRQQVPSLNERFIQLLEQDIRHLFELQATLGRARAKERVAALLCELALIASGPTPLAQGARIKVPLTQRLIADAAGLE
jgi:CRP/FNR family transcriptional regulator, anaerobic regulatory protein